MKFVFEFRLEALNHPGDFVCLARLERFRLAGSGTYTILYGYYIAWYWCHQDATRY